MTPRERMVIEQIKNRGLTDEKLLRAFRRVPREQFIPESLRDLAYTDQALRIEGGQTISQPYVVALMTHSLGITAGERVLEIGTGSGYGAAILSLMAHEVFSVERSDILCRQAQERLDRLGFRNVRVRCGDGNFGWPEFGPYDAISVTAGAAAVPPPLLEQMAVGARLVIPVGPSAELQRLLRITKDQSGHLTREDLGAVSFVPFVGSEQWNYLR